MSEADIAISDGKVSALLQRPHDVEAAQVIDAAGKYLLPGIIDPHVHFGLGSPDDCTSETMAAATGGVTTVGNFLMRAEPYEDHCTPSPTTASMRARHSRDGLSSPW